MLYLSEERRSSMKQYDFTSFNEMLNNFITPEELAKNIVQLLFNYASIVDEESLGQFKDDVGTLYIIHEGITKIR